jgi:drug/metabolite transporter (DMT)-like permease
MVFLGLDVRGDALRGATIPLLGLGGLVVLVGRNGGGSLPLWPTFLALFASISWAFGSVYQRRVGKPPDLLFATALQMLAGGVLLALEAAVFGEWQSFDPRAVSPASLGGLAWVVFFGSIVGYSAYHYTMHAAETALASTYAYVNPLVSLTLGYLLFGERLTVIQMSASAVVLFGVALMMWPERAVSRDVGARGIHANEEIPVAVTS